MKKLVTVFFIGYFSGLLFAQHKDFKPIEIKDLQKYFCVHSADEGPGTDYFGLLQLRLHVLKRVEPTFITKYDRDFLGPVLKVTNSRYPVLKFKCKYYFEFPSNAEWNKNKAKLTLFINDDLLSTYNSEIKQDDEFWIFFLITEYNTFDMEGYGRVVDFLDKATMIRKGLLDN